MGYFAVIDTETNWDDQVMSIGTVIADADTFSMISARYHILTPEYRVGGMFSSTLFDEDRLRPIVCSRKKAIDDLLSLFAKYDVHAIFAYNAKFDRTHLPELRKARRRRQVLHPGQLARQQGYRDCDCGK